jgi:CRP/FNR family cyclic AMP-dependent transcriptional regulator
MAAFFDYEAGASVADRNFVLLADLSTGEWDRLVDLMERRRFGAGAVVMARGEVDRALYIVASGSLEVLIPDGRHERRVRVQGPGTVIGEVAFFDGQPRSATVRALEPSEVLRLGLDAFEVLAARYPDIGRRLVMDLGRILALRLRHAEARDVG